MTASIPDTSGDLWLYMLIAYGLPLVGLFLLGWWANRQMKKQMGDDGPSMNFGGGGFGMGGGLGRSNAKEVKGEDTGVTFKDVAGQGEKAKESLQVVASSRTPASTTRSAPSAPAARCLLALRARARRCSPRPSQARRACRSSRSPAPSLSRCSWAAALPRCATSSSRPRRRPPASSSSTRSMPWARSATCPSIPTTSASRP